MEATTCDDSVPFARAMMVGTWLVNDARSAASDAWMKAVCRGSSRSVRDHAVTFLQKI